MSKKKSERATFSFHNFISFLPSPSILRYYDTTILSSPDEKVDTVYSLQIASSKPRPLFLFDFPDKWKEKGIESEKAWLVRN